MDAESSASSEQKTVSSASSEQKTVSSASSEQKTVSSASSEQKTVSSASSEQKTVSSVSSEQKTVSSVSSEQKTVSSASSEQKTEVSQPTLTPAPKYKHDWYQTDVFVVLSVLVRGLQDKDFKISIKEDEVMLSIPGPDSSEHTVSFQLSHIIIPEQSSYKIYSTKVEIKLKKRDALRWAALEGDPKDLPKPAVIENPSATPSTGCSVRSKNWDKLANELTQEDDKSVGEDALNALFQQIYGQGSDEVKKAMNKSFVESGGTVLSTNWKEVGKDKVDVKAPEGMEWRQWEH